jgi:hypothetical protein
MLAAVIVLLWRRSRPLALAAWTAVLILAAVALTLQFAGSNPQDSLANEYRAAQEQLAAIAGDPAATAPEEWLVRQSGDFGALLQLQCRRVREAALLSRDLPALAHARALHDRRRHLSQWLRHERLCDRVVARGAYRFWRRPAALVAGHVVDAA